MLESELETFAEGNRLSTEASVGRRLLGGALGGLIYTATNVVVSLLQLRLLLLHMPLEIAGIWIVVLNLGAYVLILDLGLSPTLGRGDQLHFRCAYAEPTHTRSSNRHADPLLYGSRHGIGGGSGRGGSCRGLGLPAQHLPDRHAHSSGASRGLFLCWEVR